MPGRAIVTGTAGHSDAGLAASPARNSGRAETGAAPLLGLTLAIGLVTAWVGSIGTHFLYLPVVLAACWLAPGGVLLVTVMAGTMASPLVAGQAGISAVSLHWLLRPSLLMLVGGTVALVTVQLKAGVRRLTELDRETGIKNRYALQRALARGSDNSQKLIALGCSNMNELVAAVGVQVVPALLKEMNRRLAATEPAWASQVYHYHPFRLALLSDATTDERNIIATLRRPMLIQQARLYVDAHAGVVSVSSLPSGDLIRSADAALSTAILRLQDVVAFDVESARRQQQDLELLADLAAAADDEGQLETHYQPKFTFDGQPKGCEALLRWRHPAQGMIPPGRFIPLAEQTGLIGLLTRKVLGDAIRMAALLPEDFVIAINVTQRDLSNPRFPELVSAALRESAIAPDRLELEITETTAMTQTGVDAVLDELVQSGIALTIDDFGTGFSSFERLVSMPVSSIKIDQSFVRRMTEDKNAMCTVEAMVTLAQDLDLTVVAEGIEDAETADFLDKIGCHLGQGYFLSKPLPAEDFVARFADPTPIPGVR